MHQYIPLHIMTVSWILMFNCYYDVESVLKRGTYYWPQLENWCTERGKVSSKSHEKLNCTLDFVRLNLFLIELYSSSKLGHHNRGRRRTSVRLYLRFFFCLNVESPLHWIWFRISIKNFWEMNVGYTHLSRIIHVRFKTYNYLTSSLWKLKTNLIDFK